MELSNELGGRFVKQKVLNVFKPILFLGFGIVLFLTVQRIFTPDFHERENEDYTIESVQLMQQNSVDVVLLGTSQMEYGCSPMKIYEDYGIRSYNLASSGQPIGCSYYMLKYALETQKPKAVVLDVSFLFLNEKSYSASRINSFWRYLVDNIPWGGGKN